VPLEARPFLAIAERLGTTEDRVLETLRSWTQRGFIRRFGVIVRHHELGIRHNAMTVWDLPDALASEIGPRMARFPFVTLCYRRRRSPPAWPFNLYCMIHGTSRALVLEQIETLTRELELAAFPREILFSRTCFKQRGAYYGPPEKALVEVP